MADDVPSHLDRIVAAKRAELGERPPARSPQDLAALLGRLPPTRDFEAALRQGPGPRIIAEFKRASPSAGPLRPDAHLPEIITAYERAGAVAISVLTDRHFEGTLDDLRAARSATSVPLLRKDFILDRRQLVDAREAGADAVLLIVAVLPPPTLKALIEAAAALELQVLCEAHDAHEIDRALSAGATVVGVNARDLRTFEVDLDRVIALRGQVPRTFTFVAESGVSGVQDIRRLREAGADAILVGSHLMTAPDPGQALAALRDGSV